MCTAVVMLNLQVVGLNDRGGVRWNVEGCTADSSHTQTPMNISFACISTTYDLCTVVKKDEPLSRGLQ